MDQTQMNCFVPVLTSEAGACLTLANWQEIGIDTVSYSLDALLMKPGSAFLKKLTNLRSYCGWPGTIVLNAILPAATKGGYILRSRYDGSLIRISCAELVSLIASLQPDLVILPPKCITHLNLRDQALLKTVKSFIPANEFLPTSDFLAFGRYLFYNPTMSFADFVQQIKLYVDSPLYITGELDLLQLQELIAQQAVGWIESDKPASDAFKGQVYCEQSTLALLDSAIAHQHERIDAQCSCPTCTQDFTRAYLHHLLMQTPLLSQRFLIQHNAHYYQHKIQTFQ